MTGEIDRLERPPLCEESNTRDRSRTQGGKEEGKRLKSSKVSSTPYEKKSFLLVVYAQLLGGAGCVWKDEDF